MKLLEKIKKFFKKDVLKNKTFENKTVNLTCFNVHNCIFNNCIITTKRPTYFDKCAFKDCVISSKHLSDIFRSSVFLTNSHNLALRYCGGSLVNCSGSTIDYSGFALDGSDFKRINFSAIRAKNSLVERAVSIGDPEGTIKPTYYPSACPLEGEFIAYKYVGDYIVKLLIPEDAKRSSAFGFKCRASYAKVLSINNIKNGEPINSVSSERYTPITYTVGEFVYPDSFDENRFAECSHGIHFFLNEEDAINYGKGLI